MNTRLLISLLLLAAFLKAVCLPVAAAPSPPASFAPGVEDTLVFGDAASEKAHHFEGRDTRIVTGGLGDPARISLPKTPVDYYGGDLSFDLRVDPIKQNYFTVKFWGSDVNGGQKALLYINGEQLGYRHLGDYEALNHGTDVPSFRNRFFYYTDILPLALTHGQKSLTLTIRTIGPISGYALGGGYDGYQGKMTAPSRGYYRAYTHTLAALSGLDAEKQGVAPAPPPVRPSQNSGPLLEAYQSRINGHLRDLLSATGRMQPGDIAYLAAATQQPWTIAGQDADHRNAALRQVVAKIDDQAQRLTEPDVYAKGGYQADWGGVFAPVGEAVFWMDKDMTAAQWNALLEQTLSVNGQAETRRDAWTKMLKGNFDYARTHVARISNQAEICMYGAYRSNKGLQIIAPAVAEPEASAKRFLFEPAGISPYLGNDILDAGGKLIGREKPYGDHYYQITSAGLTRENTYVAIYGEWTNILTNWWQMYGYDEILKKALINSNARAEMRYADFDDDGYRAMRMEGVIESRGPAYPDNVGYGVRLNGGHGLDVTRLKRGMDANPARYAGPEWAVYRKLANDAVGYAQQFLGDNQYLASIAETDDLELPSDYAYVKAQKPVGTLLPNTNFHWYHPEELAALQAAGFDAADYRRRAWADEDDGVVVLRDGDLTLFAGLVMKANWGINGLARIHCIMPTVDRLGTVAPDVQFDPSGQYTVRADQAQVQFMHANEPPEGPHQALAGEVLMIASQPNVHEVNPTDTPYTGYANFYALHYLKYLIGMNTTRPEYGNARSYDLRLPQGFALSRVYDFVSGKELPVQHGVVTVGPRSTVVLLVGSGADTLPMATRLISAFRTGQGVTVRWQYAAGATAYRVKRAASADGPYIEIGKTAGENTFSDKTAQGTGSYFYKVAGVSGSGAGLDSPYAPIMPPSPELLAWLDRPAFSPAARPEVVPGLAGENIKRKVSLSWKVARRGWTYDVLRGTSENGPFQTVATGLGRTQWSEDGLDFGRRYFYTVAAVSRDGIAGPQATPVSFSPIDDTIPAPWKGADIGNVGVSGSDGLLQGVFTLHAAGSDIWGSSDSFHYVYQPLSGDGTLVAHVASQENSNEWAKAGLMVRETLEPDAKNVFLFSAPGHGVILQNRSGTGGGTEATPDRSGLTGSPWLRLTRAGDTFTASASPDGQVWTQIGTVNMILPKTVSIGLVALSHAYGSLNRTSFDHVEISTP
jgi:hypothetical protein